ncbi:PLP-dependent aminotransferase family protein [Serinibacter arcticus]|uniref:MocR-like transcription factor YczR n=1 Tax=Serinibacter arcticus TaxID=1655435 RepID=UPI001304BED2|nr:PLP-dependent aminotransferase family protein [Serinibacter arcticus]
MPPVPVTAGRLASLLLAQLDGSPLERPAYASLATAVRTLAVDGRLGQDVRLPSERDLSTAMGLSRTTVTRAYAELIADGWARAQQGAGTFLRIPGSVGHAASPLVPLDGVEVDLTAAAVSCVPGTSALIERAMADLPALLRGKGYQPVGLPRLREVIAERYTRRGLPTTPDQVVVTSGAMSAIAVVLRAQVRRGDRVAVETPTYASVLGAVPAAGARVVALPAGPRSVWDADAVRATVRASTPSLAYLIPDFHNPTGELMTDEARAGTAAALRAGGTLALVDESLVDLRLDPGPMPLPFGVHSPEAFAVGSVSKPLWGGVRVGWVRCPTTQVAAVQAARLTLDIGASALDQLVAAEFLAHPDELLGLRLEALRTMRTAWLDALAAVAPTWDVREPTGGLALWVGLPERVAPELAAAAATRGVGLAVGTQFTSDGSARERVRLPLTATLEDVDAVARLLVTAYDEVVTRGTAATRRPFPLIA